MVNDTEISRVISHALRHEPWLYELEIDEEGWTSLESVAEALRRVDQGWAGLTRNDIERVVGNPEKKRHEISGDRIRALYGHSLPARLRKESAKPPDRLYHGTAPAALDAILRNGLKPMGRQFVHMSVDVQMAEQVGRRKGPSPVIIQVDAALAFAQGAAFYIGNERVWLADSVPARFLAIPKP